MSHPLDTYQGRHAVEDTAVMLVRLADAVVLDATNPHTPRHSEAHREVTS